MICKLALGPILLQPLSGPTHESTKSGKNTDLRSPTNTIFGQGRFNSS